MERFSPETVRALVHQHVETYASVPGATIVLDIDDTVLRTEGRRVLPHPLGQAVHDLAQRRGLPLVYVTARRESVAGRLWAMQQLHMLGVGTYLELRMMPSGRRNVQAYKAEERRALAAQGRCIILNMGDQWTDFDSIAHPAGNAHFSWCLQAEQRCVKLPHHGPCI